MTTQYKSFIGGLDIKFWDGVVRTFTRKTSTGGTITLNKLGALVDVTEAYGGGTDHSSTSINNALSAVTTSNLTMLFQPGTWNITDNVTIPATIGLCIPQGAIFVIASGKTLTINGTILAGSYIIFDGTGTVAGAPVLMWKDPTWFSGTVIDSTAPTYKTPKTSLMQTDTISETTAAAGVTIDGVKLKDSEPYCDVINEKTAATGVTIDGVKLKDSEPYCDVINEKTAATGVTVDGVLLKDGVVTGNLIGNASSASVLANMTNGNATGTTTTTTKTGIAVTNGDILILESFMYFVASAVSIAGSITFSGVTGSPLTGTNAAFGYDSVIGNSYTQSLSGVILITQTGTLTINSIIAAATSVNANKIGYIFLKKQ